MPTWIIKEELKIKVGSDEITFEAEGTVDAITVHRTGIDDFEVEWPEFTKMHNILNDWIGSVARKWALAKG